MPASRRSPRPIPAAILPWSLFAALAFAAVATFASSCPVWAEPPAALKDFLPDGLVRFATRQEAEQRREQLIRFIWPDGLSGGGWATHMAAALDTRFQLSFPVAGAFPLYARHFSAGSIGDAEQTFAPLYGEQDSDDADTIADQATGAASWLEIFALGGMGNGRRQIQILNHRDTCCFHGDVYETYAPFVERLVERLQPGRWQVHSDRTHQTHSISRAALEQVILPALAEIIR